MELRSDRQEGQAIVIMVFAVIALAALVGLAIDGGRLYTLRRQAQNAADAAALAGARHLGTLLSECAPRTVAGNTAIMNIVLDYARLNNIDEFSPDGDVTAWYVNAGGANLGAIRNDVPIPSGATGVAASTVATETTTFMKLFGQRNIVGVGQAMAMAGRITQFKGGFLPIAVPVIALKGLGVGEEFEIKDDDQGQFCRVHDDLCFGGSDPYSQRGWLQIGHIYNADPNVIQRAFSQTMNATGCKLPDIGATGLVGWADPANCEYPYPLWLGTEGTLGGDFILGATGEIAAARPQIQKYIGQTVYMPVFDYIYTGTCNSSKEEVCMETEFPGKPQPVNKWITGSSAYYYHIIGIVAAELTEVDGKSIYGTFQEVTIRPGEIQPGEGMGGPSCLPMTVGVMLWE
ncbi:MAG: pilus assembly protein TadG-related protein [Anaerolineae bacterium]|nr:pilus assembly protein TadG-related protein [Anaerolineae bacterium]